LIAYALIEQAELSRSPAQSASRGILRAYKKAHSGSFEGRLGFVQQLDIAMRQLFLEPVEAQKVLIISAHGVSLTGTLLVSRSVPDEEEELIDLWEYNHYFKVSPPNLTIFLSSCWGAYFGAAEALQYQANPCPVIVGPLVNVQFLLAEQMQADLLRALDGIPTALPTQFAGVGKLTPVRQALTMLFKKYNSRKYRAEYAQRFVLGIHFKIRDFHPKRAVGQLAQAVEKANTTLRELRAGEGSGVRPVYVDSRGRILVGMTRHLDDFADGVGVVGADYALSFQVLRHDKETDESTVHILKTSAKRRIAKPRHGKVGGNV
jgi:hypothetical protein